MLLAINIGNSGISVGVFEGDTPISSFCIGTDPGKSPDEYALLLQNMLLFNGRETVDITDAIIGSVVPTLTETLKSAVSRLCSVSPLVVGPGLKTGFRIMLNNPAELGADLAANAAGAIKELGAPVIICDIGSATSVNVIDKDKAFRGGAILPGVGMCMKALGKAELLPYVRAEKPSAPLGRNTVECMNAGVIYGQVAAISYFIREYTKELALPPDTPVVITGEYAEKLSEYIDIPLNYRPRLTLCGLCAIAELNAKRSR